MPLHAPHHHPPHIFRDNTLYFITARTINKKSFFNSDEKKEILRKVIKEAIKRFEISCYAWVILDNHYHLLMRIKEGKYLSKFIQNIHTNSSRLLNKLEDLQGRNIWFQYWDRCIRDERDFWKHFNYIHHNPVKHRRVEYQELVKNYTFCSYRIWLKKEGQEWLDSCFEQYPIIDFTLQADEGL